MFFFFAQRNANLEFIRLENHNDGTVQRNSIHFYSMNRCAFYVSVVLYVLQLRIHVFQSAASFGPLYHMHHFHPAAKCVTCNLKFGLYLPSRWLWLFGCFPFLGCLCLSLSLSLFPFTCVRVPRGISKIKLASPSHARRKGKRQGWVVEMLLFGIQQINNK